MASQLSISSMLNETNYNPVPPRTRMSISSLLNNDPAGEWQYTGAGRVWIPIHYTTNLRNKTSNEQNLIKRLGQPLGDLTLVQKTHLRSPYGPDYPYEPRPYPNMDGLIYRMFDNNIPVEGLLQPNIAPEQPANNMYGTAYGQYALEGRRDNSYYLGLTLPPVSFRGPGAQNDHIIISPELSTATVNNNSIPTSLEPLLQRPHQQTARYALALMEQRYQTPFQSRPTRARLDAAMALPTPPTTRPSSRRNRQPNGNVPMQRGSSLRVNYAFTESLPTSSFEDLLSTSKSTGIYNLTNIERRNKRKLEQISSGLDDFQLPVTPRDGYVIDFITGRERKRRMIDDFAPSTGRILDEQRRLKLAYEQEREEREECDDSGCSDSDCDHSECSSDCDHSECSSDCDHSECSNSDCSEDSTSKQPPPGYRIDYFTKEVRKLRVNEGRVFLRRRYDQMVERPVEEREWGYWEDGDSELDLSEWEEKNKKPERKKRAKKSWRSLTIPEAEKRNGA